MLYRIWFAILFFLLAASVFSQPSPTRENTVKVEAANTADPDAGKNSRLKVPPEKAVPIRIPKLSGEIVIDGRLDEEAWRTAAVFKDFIQVNPGDNVAPSKPTEVYMFYDEKNLYLGFRCWDEKDKIRATVAKRDNVFNEDNVRVWLDTFNDQRRAYILGFNPLGIQQDGIFTEGRGADFSVDIVMESKGVIEDWGWSVEVKIPFKSLRYVAGAGKNWGFNAARNIDRFNDEFDQWLPDDRNVSGFLIKHGKITGFDGIKYERTLEIVPSVTLSETGSRKRTIPRAGFAPYGMFHPIFNPVGVRDPGKFVNDPVKYDLGLNLKYTISPNITLDAAINPDYAEIEADAPVVTANQRFPIFFEEKRPFFLEGKEIFDTPLNPFYSRTIVDPDVAVKLTGKTGKNSFGFLAASDNAPGNFSEDERGELIDCQRLRAADPPEARRSCPIEQFVDKNALFAVFRLKRDVGAENNIGFIATARTFPLNRNFTGGFDGSFKLNTKTISKFQILGTHSRKFFYSPVRDTSEYRTGNGVGYVWNLDYTTDRFGYFLEAAGRSADYRTDAGFTRRTNTNSLFFATRFSTRSRPDKFLIRANARQFARLVYDWSGRVQEALAGANADFSMRGNLRLNVESGIQFEKIYEDEFGAKRNPDTGINGAFFGAPTRSGLGPYFSVNFSKTVNKRLNFYGFIGSIFNALDYDFGAGPRFPRASLAFRNYLASPEYADYLRQLNIFAANPVLPRPVLPQPPALDPGRGRQFDLEAGFEYKPTDPLRISLSYTKSRLVRKDTDLPAFDTNIFTLRSTYQFTRFSFVRARWDYDTLRANASGQILFGWNPNPGTAFYVGYNDNFNYNGFSPITGQFEPRFERNSRTFFIRASYLFRKSF